MKATRFPNPLKEAKAVRARAARAVVQILFIKPGGVSLEQLRALLREGFLPSTGAEERAVASLSAFELIDALVEANERLAALGLQVMVAAGFAQLATSRVEPPALAEVLEPDLTPGSGDGRTLTASELEVLAAIAIKGPLTAGDLERWFDAEKRGQLSRLVDLGMIARLPQPGGPAAYATTAEFLRAFNLESPEDLARLLT